MDSKACSQRTNSINSTHTRTHGQPETHFVAAFNNKSIQNVQPQRYDLASITKSKFVNLISKFVIQCIIFINGEIIKKSHRSITYTIACDTDCSRAGQKQQ